MLYKEYDPEVLKRLQEIELEILKDFDELCKKYHIDYFGCGGTLIGVARHAGFIPWDDDIDVGMLRKDYERFLSIAQRPEYTKKYNLVNAETIPSYPLMTTRWCKKGTKFKEESLKHVKEELGIFLDIYCFDNVPDNELMMKIHAWRSWIWGKLLILYWLDDPVLYDTGIVKTIKLVICKMAHKIIRAIPVSQEYYYRKAKKVTMEFYGKKTRRVNYMHDPKPFISMIDKDDLLPTIKMPYSGLMMSVPANVDTYLKRRFGNYMELPPEDKRHNHPPYELDLGEDE